jgi:hypothetical protein
MSGKCYVKTQEERIKNEGKGEEGAVCAFGILADFSSNAVLEFFRARGVVCGLS